MLKDKDLDDKQVCSLLSLSLSLNKIFEPEEKLDITGQTEHLYAQRPIWLAKWMACGEQYRTI